MLCLCPRGQENNSFFNCMFLNKLPRELHILLSEADMVDKLAWVPRRIYFLSRRQKERTTQWGHCLPGTAVVSAAA
jgi:hypothetical protein